MSIRNQDIEDETLTIAVEMAERKRERDAVKQAELDRAKETFDIATQLGVADHLKAARLEAERRRSKETFDLVAQQKRRKAFWFVGGFIASFLFLALILPSNLFIMFAGLAVFIVSLSF